MASKDPLPPVNGSPEKDLPTFFGHLVQQKGTVDANALTNRLATEILRQSLKAGASDVHFDPHADATTVRFRIDGALKDQLTFSRKDFPVTAQLRVMAGFSPHVATTFAREDGSFTLSVDGRNVGFRASAFPTIHGDKLVIRLLDMGHQTLSLEALGFSQDDLENLKAAISTPSGIFFVCGVTGGGKTTTLCSVLKALNRPEINIMTLEDPVEYQLPRVIQSNINPKAGFSFADGLRSILRQDPNIIMVGEVRDLETAEIAMRAALTGHLIFSTIHTISATGVVTRLLDMGIPPFLMREALIGALSQRLVRRVCAGCAETYRPSAEEIESFLAGVPPEDSSRLGAILCAPGGKFARGRGCPACSKTGYKGRTGIFELLRLSKPMRQLIAKETVADFRRAAVSGGLKTLLMDGAAKAWAGITTLDEVRRVTLEL